MRKLQKGINYDGNKNYGHYLNKDIHSSFTFMNIDEDAINKIIYNLPPKSSSGCDGISTKLLKVIAPVILKPLTHRRTGQHPFGGQTEFCPNGFSGGGG